MASEEQRNIFLVKLIEKHPCLYDSSLPDYTRRGTCDEAWFKIAKAATLSVVDCKEKWKNLRTVFARTQRKQLLMPSKKKRKYYLNDVMQFISPFIKTKVPADASSVPNHGDNISEEIPLYPETILREEIKSEPNKEANHVVNQRLNICPQSESNFPNYIPRLSEVSITAGNLNDTCPTRGLMSQTADLEFLKSLLPDVNKMSDRRKRKFKRQTLEMIDCLLGEQEDEERMVTSLTTSPGDGIHTPKG